MQNTLAKGAGLLMLFVGHIQANEITCPAVTDIHRKIESVEDIYSVEVQDDREWQSQSLVDVVDPALLQFNGAEYAIDESDDAEQTPTRMTITCKYGEINLTLEYLQVVEPGFSPWEDNRCESLDTKACKLITADYFNLSF